MSLLNQTIRKILPPDQRAIKFVRHKLAQTMTNPDGLGELQIFFCAMSASQGR